LLFKLFRQECGNRVNPEQAFIEAVQEKLQSLSPGFPLPRAWTVKQPLDESAFISITAQVNVIEDLVSIAVRNLFVSFELEAQRLGLADARLSEEHQAVFAVDLWEQR